MNIFVIEIRNYTKELKYYLFRKVIMNINTNYLLKRISFIFL